ncbi:MFS transporter [Mycolicibacterium brumae]|uniref:MFS transporter n=1 Tax=Mycolicibacterium brumae TaxID=85968 RepID=A0A2G5P879_9MYCO|nr:MFS transporter [Mycolicibacterium brumae]MCV7191313.1 MFS transporter [Mycolicibacterium brumae]PIB74569.1 MFS transporter [Mycolicibacterium brumae]RWA18944.1 hypothetical protein MBRU_17625 [Mycolicibacterium brumae DSM 44177]UWW09588.1 MFS transporter [Mycolicibacterium brumae]
MKRAHDPAVDGAARARLPAEVWVLIGANAVIALGYGVVAPVLPDYARHFGVSIAAATFVITAFAIMRLAFAAPAGLLVQRLGERTVYVTGLLIVAASTLACAFAQTYWQLLTFRALGGIGSTMFTISALGLMIRISPPDARGRVSGMFSSAFLVGSVGGPLLGSLTAGLGLAAPFLIYGVALLLVAAMVFVALRNSAMAARSADGEVRVGIRAVLRNGAYRAALLSNFATGWTAFGLRVALVPLFVIDVLGRDARMAGIALATFAIGNVTAVIPSGHLSDRIGRRRLMIAGLLTAGLATAAVGLSDDLVFFLAAALLAGFSTGVFSSPQQAAVADVLGNKARGGTAVAGFQMSADLGSILGATAVGLIAQFVSFGAAFMISGAILLVAGLVWVTAPETRGMVALGPGEHTPVRPLGPECGGEVP